MTTEPNMPPLPEPVAKFNWNGARFEWLTEYNYSKHHDAPLCRLSDVQARDRQWAERVAELERALGVARDALVAASDLYRTGLIYASDELIESVPRLRDEAISTIDAARSKEGQHHD